jgi:uncharacterized cofD-like protein
LDARGTVLPLALEPLEIVALVDADSASLEVRGQVQVATTTHHIKSIRLEPENAAVCPQAVAAVRTSDVVILGPGSWFTSVLTHFQVPQMDKALHETSARRILVLNLKPQSGETSGYSPETYLEVLAERHPHFRLDAVIADPEHIGDQALLKEVSTQMGARLQVAPVSHPTGATHDPELLASALRVVFQESGLWQ